MPSYSFQDSCRQGGTENLAKMPDNCPQNNVPCLTDMQIKLLSDWIAEGAPM